MLHPQILQLASLNNKEILLHKHYHFKPKIIINDFLVSSPTWFILTFPDFIPHMLFMAVFQIQIKFYTSLLVAMSFYSRPVSSTNFFLMTLTF